MSNKVYIPKTAGKILRWLLWIFLFILLLLTLVILLLQTHWGNNLLRKSAQAYLQKKFKTEFIIGGFELKGLHKIGLYNVMLRDRQKDTLLSFDTIAVNFNLGELALKKIGISSVRVSNLTAYISRAEKDTLYNYQFILDAFSSGRPKEETPPSGSSWGIDINKISLQHISFLWNDKHTGDFYKADFATLNLDLKKSDLDKMQFEARSVWLDSLDTEIRMASSTEPAKETTVSAEESTALNLLADKLTLTNTRFKLDNPSDSLSVQTMAANLSLTNIKYDLAGSIATGGLLTLENHQTSVTYQTKNETGTVAEDPSASTPFTLRIDSISLVNNRISADDKTFKKTYTDRFDPHHIHIDSLQLQASAIVYDSTGYKVNVHHLSLFEKGFRLKNLQANASYADTALTLDNFALVTTHNNVQGSARMQYKSVSEIMTSPRDTKLQVDIRPSKLRMDDWAYFAPEMKQNENLKNLLGKEIDLALQARGNLDQLNLSSFRIKTGGNLIQGSALLSHPTTPEKISASLKLNELTTSRNDLKALLPKGLIEDSLWHYIPEKLTVRGTLDGSMNSIRPNLNLQTSFGDLAIKGFLDNPTDKINARYDLTLNTSGLALDRIMEDTTFGNVAGEVSVKGRGFDPQTLQADVAATLREAGFQGYAYNDIKLLGSMDHGEVKANLESHDPNIDLDTDFSFLYTSKLQNIKVKSDIRQLDLYALGFMDSSFSAKGNMDIDFPVFDSGRIEGKGLLNDIYLSFGNKTYYLDTFDINAHYELDSQYIKLKSTLIDAEIKGQFSMQAIPGAIKTIIENWLVTSGVTKPFDQSLYAELHADVHIPDSLAAVIPGLKKVAPFSIDGGIDTRINLLVLLTNIKEIEYEDYHFDSIRVSLLRTDTMAKFNKAQFQVEFRKMTSPSVQLNWSRLRGQIEKGVVETRLMLYDVNNKPRYIVPVTYVNDPDKPYVSLQDTILLNKTNWQVNPDNRVYLNPKKMQGSNLILSQGTESISVRASQDALSGLPLTAEMHDFQLESLTGMLFDSTIITGMVNGKFSLANYTPLSFTSNIRIDTLTFFGSRHGNLLAAAKTTEDGKYDIDISLLGEGNDFTGNGSYSTASGEMDFRVIMNPLNLKPIAAFVSPYVDSLSGGLRGDLSIKGTFKEPFINGTLRLDSSYLIVKQTGTPLHIPSAGLRFEEQNIFFEGMTLFDSAGRPATITGTGHAENLTDVQYQLKLKTDKFLLSGKKRYEEQMVSGPLYAGMELNIKGDLTEANIRGSVRILDSSLITYIYQQSESGSSGEGLIEFFDPLKINELDSVALQAKAKPKSKFQLDVNSSINITPKSTIIIVLDELTGDQLSVNGNANLNFSMDPGGEIELVGNYELESGKYNMTLAGLIKKDFEISKGSNITWSGDLLEATTNLKAVYKIKTDAEELIQDMQSAPGASRQKFDFEVAMLIKGQLMKPEITFHLDMAEKDQAAFDGVIYTRLKQVNTISSELNKQVMGLLALNSFIADDPFSSLASSGGNFETEAFSTAGRLLTQELNDFLGSVVKDVDIDVGLDIRDDYTSGSAQRKSDLKVGIAKSFANSRLNVYVGNTFALENQNQDQDLLSGLAGDVMLEYSMTSDGRYRLKGYRETQDDLTFNGTVVETGVSFVVVVEFNKLKNAFKSRKNRKKTQ